MGADQKTAALAPPLAAAGYREIVKTSVLVGGSSAIGVALGIVRTKVLAVLIGTAGMGLFGAFNSVTTLVASLAGMGIRTSGVRQISEASGTGDSLQIARTVFVLRRTSLVLGFAGALILALLSRPISRWTFGNSSYAGALAMLSVTVLFTEISNGQTALIQGLRRIGDLAALTILGAVLSTLFGILIIYWYRQAGIVPFLICISGVGIITSYAYTRKIVQPKVALSLCSAAREIRSLLQMGFAFMASGLMSNGVGYLSRAYIIRRMGLPAAGLYQAAWNLSTVYLGLILTAMGADYYPRLTAIAARNEELSGTVNEQTEASILMAVPGLMLTLAFAPTVIHLLYSKAFASSVVILRWQILGMFGRIVSWPMAFILIAHGRAGAYVLTEAFSNLVYLVLLWWCVPHLGLAGLGVAFFGLYLFYSLIVFGVVNHAYGFRWSRFNVKLFAATIAGIAVIFAASCAGSRTAWVRMTAVSVAGVATLLAAQMLARRAGFASAWRMVIAGVKRAIAPKN